MHLDHLRVCLESLEEARALLSEWGLRDVERGQRNLKHLAEAVGVEARVIRRRIPPVEQDDVVRRVIEDVTLAQVGAARRVRVEQCGHASQIMGVRSTMVARGQMPGHRYKPRAIRPILRTSRIGDKAGREEPTGV